MPRVTESQLQKILVRTGRKQRSRRPEADADAAILPVGTVLCECRIEGNPVSKSRARVVLRAGKSVAFTPRQTRDAERVVREHVMVTHSGMEPDGNHTVGINLVFCSTANSGDIDNFIKLVCDALNGVVWRDDVQVSEITAKLSRGEQAGYIDFRVYVTGNWRVACETCGRRFRAGKGSQLRFCTKRCYDTAQRTGEYVHCAACSKRMYRSPSGVHEGNYYCSPSCKSALAASEHVCRQCGKAYPYRKQRRACCSDECTRLWHQAHQMDLARAHKYYRACPTCGGPMSRHGTKQCNVCHRSAARLRPAEPMENGRGEPVWMANYRAQSTATGD